MNIYQKINAVRKKVEYIKKDATVQGYSAVTHDMVTAMTRDALIEQGVVIVPNQKSGTSVDAGMTSKNNPIIRFEASYEIEFVNAEQPDDKLIVSMIAHANDTGDKAPGKACSYAVKYALLKVFSIETGENEESRIEGERQASKLFEYLKSETDVYIEKGDALGIYLLSKQAGQDAWMDIYNSAPKGRKTQFKNTLSEMEAQGAGMFKNINQALVAEDAMLAQENLEGLTPRGKDLLLQRLGNDIAANLGNLLKTLDPVSTDGNAA